MARALTMMEAMEVSVPRPGWAVTGATELESQNVILLSTQNVMLARANYEQAPQAFSLRGRGALSVEAVADQSSVLKGHVVADALARTVEISVERYQLFVGEFFDADLAQRGLIYDQLNAELLVRPGEATDHA